MIENLKQNHFIILAKSPNWDAEDFGDLVLKMKARKDREVMCAVTDERNYDFLFNTLQEAGKKEEGGFMFERTAMVEDNPAAPTRQCENCIRNGLRECMYHGYPEDAIPTTCGYKIGNAAIDTVYDVPVLRGEILTIDNETTFLPKATKRVNLTIKSVVKGDLPTGSEQGDDP